MDPINLIDASINRELQMLSTVSQNIANVNTPGYQSVQTFNQVLESGTVETVTHIAPSKSAINDTNRPLDVAIVGEGYFIVELNNEFFLTKNGRFHVGPDGYLTHSSGAKLVGENGKIDTYGEVPSINTNGDVSVNGSKIAQLALVKTDNLARTEVASLYRASSAVTAIEVRTVKPSALNASSVVSSDEMTQMMSINRNIQSLQKVVHAYDQMLNSGINEMGRK
ncbi:flagellar hook-basal body complex protein [Pseudoalteromonas sp. SMS1]|uniref:flagellar hook-basal body complex protein n=1 Tax=Pseudoalteromonas sp. SMS1 TaxID=2908894 RepID=UPI001F25535C|nr:flagellar hook-basal body complex protein [Pseudoalteromonas sp. SMS1]MCF2860214.1 flagellar hook-basal body complex protein [Pseudoalteromonas sp. SMS1]